MASGKGVRRGCTVLFGEVAACRRRVSPKSIEWGYKPGSVYVRKVHFRDSNMIKQIEEKVVNRLRQVTSAIKQDGANPVSVITSPAEHEAAIEFAKAKAMRPKIVGEALRVISADPEVANAVFDVLEIESPIEGKMKVTFLPEQSDLLAQMTPVQDDRVRCKQMTYGQPWTVDDASK
jgi:hypothetical protein